MLIDVGSAHTRRGVRPPGFRFFSKCRQLCSALSARLTCAARCIIILPMDARELVCDYLKSLQQGGALRLPVDDGARAILRAWMLGSRAGGQAVAAAPAVAMAAPALARPAPSAAPGSLDALPAPAADTPRAPVRLLLDDEDDVPAGSPQAAADEAEEIPFFRPGGESAEERRANMERMLPNWRPLRELGTLRAKAVPGRGAMRAGIMMVGDAPGYQDELAGLPFQGEAGGKLDGMLRAMGLTREDVYLTQLVKFRPALPRQTFNNRPPSAREIAFSMPIIDCEVQLLRPRVIVALGVIAARGLLGRGELPLAAYLGQPGEFAGIPVVVTHHPSYLLRTSDLGERRRLWEEMLRVMELAGLPISDKQRGYFLPKN